MKTAIVALLIVGLVGIATLSSVLFLRKSNEVTMTNTIPTRQSDRQEVMGALVPGFPDYPAPENPFPAPVKSATYTQNGFRYYEAEYAFPSGTQNPVEDLSEPLFEQHWVLDTPPTDVSPTVQTMVAHDPATGQELTLTAEKIDMAYNIKLTIKVKI